MGRNRNLESRTDRKNVRMTEIQEIDVLKTIRKSFIVRTKEKTYHYDIDYDEETKVIHSVTFYDFYGTKEEEIVISNHDLKAIRLIMEKYGLVLTEKGDKKCQTTK